MSDDTKPFNIIRDNWLPFKLADGTEQVLPMSAICRSDVLDFALPRADFQGAAYQFAIGLLQTVFAPVDDIEWIERYEQPPSEDELQAAFNQVEHAFNVEGDGPLFMQDYDELEDGNIKNIDQLLIETPGDNGIKENKDHFIKRDKCEIMSREMAAIALLTLQLNAPPNKACKPGRVGLRGAGPLSTLVMPSQLNGSLWIKLWLNVINNDFLRYETPNFHDGSVFPWLAQTKTSERKGSEIYFHDVHPLHMFWAMPSRIRLIVNKEEGVCQITGHFTDFTLKEFRIEGNGNNYEGEWAHTLTPYRFNKKSNIFLSVKGSADLGRYQNWSDFSFIDCENREAKSAAVVDHFYSILPLFLEKKLQLPNLWLFAYDLDQAKLNGWYSSRFPLFNLNEDMADCLFREIKSLIDLSQKISSLTLNAIKLASYGRINLETKQIEFGKKNPAQKSNNVISESVNSAFWQRTESIFFTAVAQLVDNTEQQAYTLKPEQAKAWLTSLRTICLDLFDEYALSELGNQKSMAKRIKARQQLAGWLFGGKDIKAFMANHNIEFNKEVA